MNSKEIKEQRDFLNCYKTLTKEQELKLEELDFRELIMCCLAYGTDVMTSRVINMVSEYYGRPYFDEYADKLGKERALEIYEDQKRFFDTKCIVQKNVYTDCEGVTYNSLVEVE